MGALADRISRGKRAPIARWPAPSPEPLAVEPPDGRPEWVKRNERGENRPKDHTWQSA